MSATSEREPALRDLEDRWGSGRKTLEEDVVEVAGEVGAGERKPPAEIGGSDIVVHGEENYFAFSMWRGSAMKSLLANPSPTSNNQSREALFSFRRSQQSTLFTTISTGRINRDTIIATSFAIQQLYRRKPNNQETVNMPNIATYGVEVKLQSSAAAATSSTLAGHNQSKQQTVTIKESAANPIWIPSVGMNHPIWVTTVQTPVKTSSEAAIPMKVVVNFKDPNELPDYMKGDMRVELMVDGVVSGLKFYRDFKLRGKGFNLEFSGYRVDRTKERGFVFNALPETFGDSAEVKDLPNYGIDWAKNALKIPNPDPRQIEGEYPFGGLYPVEPLGLPPHVSHVQVLVSVGKKHRTLERYFMAGATQKAAFYSPPRAPAQISLDVQQWLRFDFFKKYTNSTAAAAIGNSAAETPKNRRVPSIGEQVLARSSNKESWKPVGLARTQKMAQAKEVEFAVRIHLCRFWFFIGTYRFLD
jgi:hypothetical protein